MAKKTGSKMFYDDLEYFHKETENIQKILADYNNNHKDAPIFYKYGSVHFEDGKIVEYNFDLPTKYKDALEDWVKEKQSKTFLLTEKILKIDLSSSGVFLCKIFNKFGDDAPNEKDFVISGYISTTSIEFMLYLYDIVEDNMKSCHDKIISILGTEKDER